MKYGGGICVSIAEKNVDDTITAAQQSMAGADVIEIRLDAMDRPEIVPVMVAVDKPLLFTCRPAWEGGMYEGEEQTRIELLVEAARGGAAFIDLEAAAGIEHREALLTVCRRAGCMLILSHHEFKITPDKERLDRILEVQIYSGADIGKIVTTANETDDVVRMMALQVEASQRGFPLSAFCMGEIGRISRVATLPLGGFMTYTAANETRVTAPGQLDVAAMQKILRLLAV